MTVDNPPSDRGKGKDLTPTRAQKAAATKVLVRHTTYQVGSVVGCTVCSEVWPCYEVRQARKVLNVH